MGESASLRIGIDARTTSSSTSRTSIFNSIESKLGVGIANDQFFIMISKHSQCSSSPTHGGVHSRFLRSSACSLLHSLRVEVAELQRVTDCEQGVLPEGRHRPVFVEVEDHLLDPGHQLFATQCG